MLSVMAQANVHNERQPVRIDLSLIFLLQRALFIFGEALANGTQSKAPTVSAASWSRLC
jgi:hypothetical protein